MIKEKTNTILVSQTTVIEKTCVCDICKKIIWKKNLLSDAKTNYSNMVSFYKVTTGHYDWGRDSVDSIEDHQVCIGCLNSFVADYFKSASGTEYMNIQREWLYSADMKSQEEEEKKNND